jgi:ribosomal protein S18 acetylase RimI-like enzyme
MENKTNNIEALNFECKVLVFGSADQQLSLLLREQVLRAPLGLTFSEQDLLHEDEQMHIGGYLNNSLCAILLLKPDGQALKMRQVAVDPKLQGKGIGKALVRFAEQLTQMEGYSKIHLHARDTAIPFYLNLQYKIEGAGFSEVGIPHHYMYKVL